MPYEILQQHIRYDNGQIEDKLRSLSSVVNEKMQAGSELCATATIKDSKGQPSEFIIFLHKPPEAYKHTEGALFTYLSSDLPNDEETSIRKGLNRLTAKLDRAEEEGYLFENAQVFDGEKTAKLVVFMQSASHKILRR